VKNDFLEQMWLLFSLNGDTHGLGWLEIYRENYRGAYRIFQSLSLEHPGDPEAMAGLGISEHFLGYPWAAEDCKQAIKMDGGFRELIMHFISYMNKAPERGLRSSIIGMKEFVAHSTRRYTDIVLGRDIDRSYLNHMRNVKHPVVNGESFGRTSTFTNKYQRQLEESRRCVNVADGQAAC
jgi:hypothetical protein